MTSNYNKQVFSPYEIDSLLRNRLTEALLAQARIGHDGLNAFLRDQLAGYDKANGALLTDPIVEGSPGYLSSEKYLKDLKKLIHPRLCDALTSCSPEFRFDYPVYRHQLEAWSLLSDPTPQSVLVSSGTGSGKTECFLIPMLNDLANLVDKEGVLIGVRAIMLYPLNALIASQKERLDQWTAPFGKNIRFALYNGLMSEARERESQKEESAVPNQILYRKTLRKNPPPIIVTNKTMLEYMTIRREDKSIIDASYGKLRWIIIDEAHSYVGSSAAELSLLLRRVMHAFGVLKNNLRIVATSATIGNGSKDDRETLQRFIADIAGIPLDRAHVVIGRPREHSLPKVGPVVSLSPQKKLNNFELSRNPAVQAVIHKIGNGSAAVLEDLKTDASVAGLTPIQLSEMLAQKSENEIEPLLPQRVHSFLRSIPGLWSCLNPECFGKKPKDWSFGAVLFEKIDNCPHCQSPVFEIVSCRECCDIYLIVDDFGDRLVSVQIPDDSDEFAAVSARLGEAEFDEDNEEDENSRKKIIKTVANRRLISSRHISGCSKQFIDAKSGWIVDSCEELTIWLSASLDRDAHCPNCQALPAKNGMGPIWPFRFGSPFLMQNVVPTMLQGVSPEINSEIILPAGGRRLISFTDSRQGTARLASNIETVSERSFVRSFIYHAVQTSGLRDNAACQEDDKNSELIAKLEKRVKEDPNDDLSAQLLADKRLQVKKKSIQCIEWDELVKDLAREPILVNCVSKVWDADRDDRYQNKHGLLANFLLLRELARRPRRANSVETLGLAQLIFPDIEKIPEQRLPYRFGEKGKSIIDWKNFLYFLVERLRGYFAIRIDEADAQWLPGKSFPRAVIGPRQKKNRLSDLVWPSVKQKGRQTNIILALCNGLGLDLSEGRDCDLIDDLLNQAWNDLGPIISGFGSIYALDLSKSGIAPVKKGWRCPVTGTVLTRLVFGKSPYSLASNHPDALSPPQELVFPSLPLVFPKTQEQYEIIEKFINTDAQITALRSKRIWNNLHDQSARSSSYIRAEEHSAQQPPWRLRRFEEQFKAGEINLLACSTTMEMGVDIGSIEAVLNSNVPPSIANYKQRVGRAGRRGQGFAFSITLARNTPLERETFNNPIHYLSKKVHAPQVSLESERIVQRHVNAMLLGRWLAEADGQLTKLKSGAFFGCGVDFREADKNSLCEEFEHWLSAPSTEAKTADAIKFLVRGTALSRNNTLWHRALQRFCEERKNFVKIWQALAGEYANAPADAKKSVQLRALRLVREPLLKELANRSLIPGSGFPTSVIPLLTDARSRPPGENDEDQDTSAARRYSEPSRNADIAIREYAPGADVVVDGLVWRSAGITLNWQRPAAEEDIREIQNLRWLWNCAQCSEAGVSLNFPYKCEGCSSPDIELQRIIEPSGFRVDRRDKPHVDTDNVSYIDPIAPRISARNASWVSFLDPALGRMRAAADGMVLHLSRGKEKRGYQLCLECGRMADDSDVSFRNHAPLAYAKENKERCVGNDKPFSQVGQLTLAHEVLTDVCELQPEGLEDEGVAWAIIAALRDALTRELGIELRELGLGVSARSGRLGGHTHSLFLFDQASGGAGYTPRLFDNLPKILKKAQEILDCPLECENGCSACVLSKDLFAQQEKLKRKLALEWIKKLNTKISFPNHDDEAIPNSVISQPVADALVAAMSSETTISLYLRDALPIDGLLSAPLSVLFDNARQRGICTELVISPKLFSGMDDVMRRSLHNAALRAGFRLLEGLAPDGTNKSRLIATLTRNSQTEAFYSRDLNAQIPSCFWGVGLNYPIVRGQIKITPKIRVIEDSELEIQSFPGDRVRLISNDGIRRTKSFGINLVKDILKPEIEAAGMWKPGKLLCIDYSDRYLKSPLTLLLAMRTAAALRDELVKQDSVVTFTIATRPIERTAWSHTPWKVNDDWEDGNERRKVAAELAKSTNFSLKFKEGDIAHGRILTLYYINGEMCRLLFDQGFGYWAPSFRRAHNFRQLPAEQSNDLMNLDIGVSGKGESYIAFVQNKK